MGRFWSIITTNRDLRKIVSNVRYTIMCCSQDSLNHTKQLKDVQDFTWSADYAMEDDVRNQREKIKNFKCIGKSHFTIFESWICRNAYCKICAIGRRVNCWCNVQHDWVYRFGHGLIKPFGFRFEWRETWGGGCGWPTNIINQACSSLW